MKNRFTVQVKQKLLVQYKGKKVEKGFNMLYVELMKKFILGGNMRYIKIKKKGFRNEGQACECYSARYVRNEKGTHCKECEIVEVSEDSLKDYEDSYYDMIFNETLTSELEDQKGKSFCEGCGRETKNLFLGYCDKCIDAIDYRVNEFLGQEKWNRITEKGELTITDRIRLFEKNKLQF